MLPQFKIIVGFMSFLPVIILLVSCDKKEQFITIHPVEIDSTLVNPGRGFTTTGNIFNENLGDRLHPHSGVTQQRWYWDELEPEEGQINFSMIDSVLEIAARNKQQLNLRVMCQDVEMKIPQWAMDQGIKRPYYDDPIFLEKQENLIKALAVRYDGHPHIAFMDIGTVGQWGEWHTSSSDADMPSDESVIKIIDLYLDNFKKTPSVMLIGGARGPGLSYALQKGAGWRADCWGDMGDKWNHMRGFYPEALESSNAYDAWKKGPIALETCWTMDEWYQQGWDIDYILSKALEWHTTEVNNGSESIPVEWWPKVKEFEKKLGYRFVLNKIEFPSRLAAGDSLNYSMVWENKGVAPIYQEYPLAFYFQSVDDASIGWSVETEEDIRQWMPGSTNSKSSVKIPKDMADGKYEMFVGLINPDTKKPAIQLAIEGKNSEGWYKLGEVQLDS